MKHLAVVLAVLVLALTISLQPASGSPPLDTQQEIDIPATALDVDQGKVYVAGGGCWPTGNEDETVCGGQFSILTLPQNVVLGQLPSGNKKFLDVDAQGQYAYVLGEGPPNTLSLHVIDVTNPTQPVQVNVVNGVGRVDGAVKVGGNFVYVSSYEGVRIFDASDPVEPVQAAFIEERGEVKDIDLEGTTLFVLYGDWGGWLHTYDVADPTNPTRLGEKAVTYPTKIVVDGTRAFIRKDIECGSDHGRAWTCQSALLMLDVSDPTVLAWGWAKGLPTWIFSLAPMGADHLLVGVGTELELWDLARQRSIAELDLGQNIATDVVPVGEMAYVAVGPKLVVAQVTIPNNTYLAMIGRPIPRRAFAQGPDNRIGLGGANDGDNINWAAQSTETRNAYDWRDTASQTTRTYYRGPDVLGTWQGVDSEEYDTENRAFFASVLTGPTANIWAAPVDDTVDYIFLGHHDVPNCGELASPNSCESDLSGTYNLNAHSLKIPGTIHLHDTNGDDEITCGDAYNCDVITNSGPTDGGYMEEEAVFDTFVRSQNGGNYVIGAEYSLLTVHPYVAAKVLLQVSNYILARDPNANIYFFDVGNITGLVDSRLVDDVWNEPGTSSAKDGGDYWYTVAWHYDVQLNGPAPAGFASDMGLYPTDRRRRCTDVENPGAGEMDCLNVTNGDDWVDTDPVGDRWFEKRAKPVVIQDDIAYWGGRTFHNLMYYLAEEVQYPIYLLARRNSDNTSIAEMFGLGQSTFQTGQTYGMAGKTLGFGNHCITMVSPYARYMTGTTEDEDLAPWSGWNTAGYHVCDLTPDDSETSGVFLPPENATFELIVFQGVGQARTQYRYDSNNDGQIDDIYDSPPAYRIASEPHGDLEDALMFHAVATQVAIRWAKNNAFSNYPIMPWFYRNTHMAPDQADGDVAGPVDECSSAEYGLIDADAGGNRLPGGDTYWQAAGYDNTTWWDSGTWQPSSNSCFNAKSWPLRPDQNTDNDGQGGSVEPGDLPPGW